jgi:hypothetical protein
VLFAQLLKKYVVPFINSYRSKLPVTVDRWQVPQGLNITMRNLQFICEEKRRFSSDYSGRRLIQMAVCLGCGNA